MSDERGEGMNTPTRDEIERELSEYLYVFAPRATISIKLSIVREECDALRVEVAALREALLKHHHSFQHEYIKDEKKCETCRLLARPTPGGPQ